MMAEEAIIVTTRRTISTKPQPSSVPMHCDLPFRKGNVMLVMTHSTPPTLALQVAVVAETAALGGLDLCELGEVAIEGGLICWLPVWRINALVVLIVHYCSGLGVCGERDVLLRARAAG